MEIARLNGLSRLERKIRKTFLRSWDTVLRNKDFYIDQLNVAIDAGYELLETVSNECTDWFDSITAVNEVDEFNSLWERISLFFMKIYVHCKYEKSMREYQGVLEELTKLEGYRYKLIIMKAFR